MILDEYEMKLLHNAADNGDTEALFRLGKAHMNSYSEEHYNPEEAEILLRQATELGHIGAEAMLGSWLLDNGNHDEGIRLLTEAAENGDSSAQSKLGTYYRFRNDYEQAVKWLEKAGKHDEYAYYQLSLCYEEGHGVKKDIRKAKKMWEELSEETPYGDTDLGFLYLNGEGGFKKNYRKAAKYFTRSIIKHDPCDFINLAIVYNEGGYGVPQNLKNAYLCYFLFDIFFPEGHPFRKDIFPDNTNDRVKEEMQYLSDVLSACNGGRSIEELREEWLPQYILQILKSLLQS